MLRRSETRTNRVSGVAGLSHRTVLKGHGGLPASTPHFPILRPRVYLIRGLGGFYWLPYFGTHSTYVHGDN